jgi:hypothetical protein
VAECRAVLGGLADVERDLIRTRTAEGRSRAAEARGSAWAGRRKINAGTEGRSPAATGGGCYACRTRVQLRRRKEHDFPAMTRRLAR